MRPLNRVGLMITATLLVASLALGASLDRAGTWTATTFVSGNGMAKSSRALVPDGSFELGPPPASGWTEVTIGNCEWIGDNSGSWYVSAYDGSNDVWIGGYCEDDEGIYGPTTTTVSQDVDVPLDDSMLTFYYIALRMDLDDEPADGDRAYVAVNGTEVWTLPFTQENNTYPEWVGPIAVNLSGFAGQTITLTFGGEGVGDATGNARFDFIEFVNEATATEAVDWGTLKSLFR